MPDFTDRGIPKVQTKIENFFSVKEGGTVNVTHLREVNRGRPPLPETMDPEIKARVEPRKLKEIMAFCAGRQITRSDYIRGLTELDADYFDHIETLNHPEVKEAIFSVLRLLKKF